MQTALPQPLKRRRGHGVELKVVRNGSRGAFGLEPLVEVEMHAERIAFGAVKVSDVPSIIESLETGAHSHERYLGPTTEIPWFRGQTRITFKRCGLGVPTSLENYQALGGYQGLERALALSPQAIVDEVKHRAARRVGGIPNGNQMADSSRYTFRTEIHCL